MKQVREVRRARLLQGLRPLPGFGRGAGQRLGDPGRLVRRAVQQNKRRAQAGGRRLQLRVQAGQGGVFREQLPEDLHRVAQPAKNLRREDFFGRLFPQAGTEGEQVAREVAAVHAGNIERGKGPERAGLIPVQEVPAIPLEALHGGEGILRALDQAAGRKIAEIPGGQIGQERQAHVRGRGPRGDRRDGDFLKIVGGQPVLPGRDKRFEVVPGLPGGVPQKSPLPGRQIRRRGFDGLADPPGDPRGRQPQAEVRQRPGQFGRLPPGQQKSRGQRDDRRDPHRGIEAGQAGPGGLFGVARGLPFEEPPPRHQQAQQRPRDGVQADVGVVGEKGEGEDDLAELPAPRPHHALQVHRPGQVGRFAEPVDERRQQSGEGDDGHDQQRAQASVAGQQQPGAEHQEQQGGGDEAAAQVVEDFPLRQHRQRIGDAAGVGSGHPRQEPLRDLPVAAHPAVTPVDVHVVAGGMVFVELHIADEGGTGMARLQQIMAEHGVFRAPAVHGPLESIHIVDTLADERAFLKNILIHIGHLPGVGIDPRLAGEQPDKPGSPGARQTHAHARLQNAVAFGDDPARRVELRTVQRMGHGGHEPAGGVAGELGVGVERDDILHRRQNGRVSLDGGKACGVAAAEEFVKRHELSPLALIAHPPALAGVPAPRAVEQVEHGLVPGRILGVQPRDAGPCLLQQPVVSRENFRRRIPVVRQQGKVQMRIAVREGVNLQGLEEPDDAFRTREQRGNDHHRAAVRIEAGGVVQARELAGFHEQGGQPVRQRHRQLTGAEEENQGEKNQFPALHVQRLGQPHKTARREQRGARNATRIIRQRKAMDAAFNRRSPGPAHLHRPRQRRPAFPDQKKSHMRGPTVAGRRPGPVGGQPDRVPRDLAFRPVAVPGEKFDRVAIAVARRKIHLAIDAGRVGAQGLLDQAQRLHERLPVHGAQQAQAGNAVAHGDLVGRLILAFQLDPLFDRQPLFGEPLLQPAAREMQRRALPRQTLAEFRHEGTGEGQVGLRHVGHHDHEVRRIFFRHGLQAIHPGVRKIPVLPGDGQPGGDPLEILNQPKPQHDGNGPQLAQLQRSDGLIGGDEGAERFGLDLRVRVRDQLEHEVVDARQSGRPAGHQAGQFPAVTPGQMSPGQLDLLFDEVEIVEEPFGGRRDVPARIDGQGRAVKGP